ncbi:LacI family transcriptional regulator [Bifidobacterium primatium]|uniref:LacI family transcriptional regulator n=1 Tax=Bifidobacterium primatium TaxID=2045438 RepID=A0A2M9H6N7_9BIFI|nr:substrate-binding domain-containing protein [Bifidobacterium primatium]PJM72447.1 LacI family transcriptional regulator [Bifidobacterium primatium]
MSTNRKPKISEIAELANVSPSTVSKVINGRAGISEQTRSQVEEALAKLGYSKPLVSTKVSQTIEIITEYIENNGTIELIRHAAIWGKRHQLGITVNQKDPDESLGDCLRQIINRNPSGVIIQQFSKLSEDDQALLDSRDIPWVIIDPVDVPDDNVNSVSVDNWTGGYQATQYLVQQGHTRIGVISGLKQTQSAIARFSGYLAALRQAGIEYDSSITRESDYRSESGYQAACSLLDMPNPPTAIFACNDLTAVNVYKAANERGLELPRQLSVVGFDDVYPAAYLSPPLTTVEQPFGAIANAAVQMIMNIRAHKTVERHITLPTHLIVRDSVTAPLEHHDAGSANA